MPAPVFAAEKIFAKYDEQNYKRANVKPEQSASEQYHKQDYNPQHITARISGASVAVTVSDTAATSEAAKASKQIPKHFYFSFLIFLYA